MAGRPKRQRGRPAFRATAAMKTTVERMMACGDSQNTIARALGIDDDTLRKHFPEEIRTGAAKRRREVIDLLFAGARKGNSALIKRVEEMTRTSAGAADFDQPEAPAKAPRVSKLGKKEVAHQDALAAGADNEWGDDLKPASTLPN